jgi:hypothetical protein
MIANKINILDIGLHYLGRTGNPALMVQIGAMDGESFDDTVAYVNMYGWQGLYVEPISYYFNKLVRSKKVTDMFEQSAIVEQDGMVEMVVIDKDAIENKTLHEGFAGMSAVYPPRNGLKSEGDAAVLKQCGKIVKVNGITLNTLFTKHDIQKFDMFICDAEGFDAKIFRQLDLTKYAPKIIRLEFCNLEEEEKTEVISKLDLYGYVYEVNGQNIDALSKDFWAESTGVPVSATTITQENELTEIMNKYGSDKPISGYTIHYDVIFNQYRNVFTNVLEIGIGTLDPSIPSSFAGIDQHNNHYTPGGSLRGWRDYFVNAQVIGVDVAEDCRISEDRISTYIFSSLDTSTCNQVFADSTFDLILDDGLHTAIAQLQTFINLFPKVRDNGYYIVEDVGGAGDSTTLIESFGKNFKAIADKHEWMDCGNFIVIRKTGSGRGMQTFPDFIEKLPLPAPAEQLQVTENLTLVTGLWDIGRNGRDFSHYIANFKKFLDIPANLFIYLPAELEYLVWENPKRNKKNTHVRITPLDFIKNNYYATFWDATKEIRSSEKWLNQAGWLGDSPQATNEWYNPIVQSKMFMLHDAKVMDVFKSEYFLWLDAGITNTVYDKYFTENRCLDEIIPLLDTFLFLSYPYEANTEIHGFDFAEMNKLAKQKVKYVCRGGLFGGHKDYISGANSTYYALLNDTLSRRLMGTEESIFSIMAHLEPHIYKRYALHENGLVVKFTQALVDKKVHNIDIPLETADVVGYNLPKGTYNPNKDKTSIYVLAFNFPEQFRTLLKSFEQHPEWLRNPRKILIDNSNNQEAIDEYEVICKEYDFEHIITGENLGINRGRHFVAKHFDESDSDYYIFFEDDMCFHSPDNKDVCRNGFRKFVPNLYENIHHIMAREQFDFLKLSFTEVYMDNNIQVSWYNVPQHIRTELWPEYNQLPVSGLDPFAPRTKFNTIDVFDGVSYISGDIYYANWPMIVSREGNKKMFLTTEWARPYEQTWMSYMFQETITGNLKPAILLASPINHNRISHYKPEDRREN